MPHLVAITTLDDSRVSDYQHLMDPAPLVARGLFVAEGRLVVRQLLNLPQWQLHSILLTAATAENLGVNLPSKLLFLSYLPEAVNFNLSLRTFFETCR